MKSTVMLTGIALFGAVLLAAPAGAQETQVFKTLNEKMSYVVGAETAKGLKAQGIELDMDLFIKGVQDGLSGGKLLLSNDEFRNTKSMFTAELRRKRNEMKRKRPQEIAEENKKEGEAFLAENRTKEGVVTLPSGLQYKVIKAGDGRKPTDADTVEVHYRGTLLDGTQINSSLAGDPEIMKVKGLIPGLTEALRLMPVGSKWQLFIPPQLAYGERQRPVSRQGQAPQHIGANQTVIFEVELIAIK